MRGMSDGSEKPLERLRRLSATTSLRDSGEIGCEADYPKAKGIQSANAKFNPYSKGTPEIWIVVGVWWKCTTDRSG
jgi:hypothetical protein